MILKIVVLAGGISPERDVSLSSGSLIAAALRRRGHKVLMLDVFLGMHWDGKNADALFEQTEEASFTVGRELPNLKELCAAKGGECVKIGPGVLDICRAADVTFLALHGGMGENGQLQAILDIYGIAYTGSGYVGSTLAMEKNIAKIMLENAGIRTPVGMRVELDRLPDMEEIVARVGLPAVVKPCSCGSSVGVCMVENREELCKAIAQAGAYEDAVLIEKRIFGRELTCAYLDGRALPPVEIIPKSGFYDYVNKYQANATTELCPAPLSVEETKLVAEATERGFAALRLGTYARFDYILDREGVLWCLEANTLPGMTPTSLLPQEAAAVGIEYDELCEMLALSAWKKKVP